ncbi:DUF805 domain-containing protein [Sphingomonas sp. AR_OL41]|uniref:DUF805 domain-containing protein n=1 Tax=Sphingomonas sp. AR_OL41 TaxID=3042729 RepID=UPI002481087E|nr:DUF805 domain-containing protein [Sphingomonas sp. AR_OL41]MDH7974809.1 DUF805 domain-containing protein [Sphingomonas sp. AR_OL41]
MEWMLMPLKRYAQFSGRSRRKEYWMYFLFIIIALVVMLILDSVLGLGGRTTVGPGETLTPGGTRASYGFATSAGVLTTLLLLGTFIPSLAVGVRRLHDANRSGWWILSPLVPYALGAASMLMAIPTGQFALMGIGFLLVLVSFGGAIMLLVWFCLPGTTGDNDYGPDPLDPGAGENLSDVFS